MVSFPTRLCFLLLLASLRLRSDWAYNYTQRWDDARKYHWCISESLISSLLNSTVTGFAVSMSKLYQNLSRLKLRWRYQMNFSRESKSQCIFCDFSRHCFRTLTTLPILQTTVILELPASSNWQLQYNEVQVKQKQELTHLLTKLLKKTIYHNESWLVSSLFILATAHSILKQHPQQRSGWSTYKRQYISAWEFRKIFICSFTALRLNQAMIND